MPAPIPDNDVDEFSRLVGKDWPNIRIARETAIETRQKLKMAVHNFEDGDTSIVVFGSLGRDEATRGSDVDWNLLIDGVADATHLDVALAIRKAINETGEKQPGREGTFGNLAFSHELVHLIGGEDDTNSNTTHRILLLLESQCIGRRDAYDRVISNVLFRYLDEDRGLWHGSAPYKVPRFLLNDIARYWRTMAVDFAYKQRSRGNEGFALRNIKLRMSRKLIYIAGLLLCFSCHFLPEEEKHLIYGNESVSRLIAHLQHQRSFTPLELVAKSMIPLRAKHGAAAKLFTAYDDFLGLLNDETKLSNGNTPRKHLDTLSVESLAGDKTFDNARDISHRFQDGVREIFLTPDTKLGQLTIEYGVF